mgnify:CR=1 FL=1
MKKSELISKVSQNTGIDIKTCETIVHSMIDLIKESMATGEKITLSGFGTFERRVRKQTIARNPKTLEPMTIEQQYVAAFRAGTSLKDAVKSITPL